MSFQVDGRAHRMQEASILVVESDPDAGRALTDQLAVDGYAPALASSTGHARALAGARAPMLAILGGLGSPRDALDLLEEIRRGALGDRKPDLCTERIAPPWMPRLPVIVIGQTSDELGLLRAFEAGADDYICRPVRYLELRARIRALLRRGCQSADTVPLFLGPLSIDLNARAVRVHGELVELRRLEYELLCHLAHDPERVCARHELLRVVWGDRCPSGTRTLDSHASRLRCKLATAAGEERFVINVRGVGYRLI